MLNLAPDKAKYNELLKRWHRYEAFVENESITMDEKLKYVPQAKELVNNMGIILNKLKQNGYEYTDKEVLETGFVTEVGDGQT